MQWLWIPGKYIKLDLGIVYCFLFYEDLNALILKKNIKTIYIITFSHSLSLDIKFEKLTFNTFSANQSMWALIYCDNFIVAVNVLIDVYQHIVLKIFIFFNFISQK